MFSPRRTSMRSKVKKSNVDDFLRACKTDTFKLSVDKYAFSLSLVSKKIVDVRRQTFRQIRIVRKGICGQVSDQSGTTVKERSSIQVMGCLETIQ